jgi:hypothetical protein
MRLKLPGADRLSGSGALCPWRGTDFVHQPCASGRVARSLSTIRLADADAGQLIWVQDVMTNTTATRHEIAHCTMT